MSLTTECEYADKAGETGNCGSGQLQTRYSRFRVCPHNYSLSQRLISSYGDEIAENNAANLGLRDQIKALEWVKQNIWAWGGDPDRVSQIIVIGILSSSV
jgi:hypothetical protein